MSILLLALDLYFAAMLAVSGLAKIDNTGCFAHLLRRHGTLPAWSIPTVSVTLPWLVPVVAGLLITGVAIIPTAVAVAGLFLSFLAVEVFLVATKRATDCGCYGVAFPQEVDGASVAASVVLTSLAMFHLWAMTWVAPLDIVAAYGASQAAAGVRPVAVSTLGRPGIAGQRDGSTTQTLGQVAYVQGGNLWIKALPDGQPCRLTDDGVNLAPLWSPSGEWLAFRKGSHTGSGQELWVIRRSGLEARAIAGTRLAWARQVAWSPVSDRLAYVKDGGLFAVNADGTDLRVLVPPLQGSQNSGVGRIAWSPDGTWLAFDRRERTPGQPTTEQGLWRIRADGSALQAVFLNPDPTQTQSLLAGWSPDGRFLLFWEGKFWSASISADGLPLWTVPAAGGAPQPLGVQTLLHDSFVAGAPSRNTLAVTDGNGRETWTNKRIALVDVPGGQRRALSDAATAAFSPAWSPDGQRLAYVAGPDVGSVGGGSPPRSGAAQRRIWVIHVDGTGAHPVTGEAGYRDERPLWSADGQQLLFARLSGDDRASLWLMRDDGGQLLQVADNLGPTPGPAPSWFGYYGHIWWERLFDWWQSGRVPHVP